MDSNVLGILGIIFGPLAGVVGAIITTRVTRKNNSETNNIAGFEANLQAFDKRAQNAEARVVNLETRVEELEAKDQVRDRQLARIKVVVQDWFRALRAQWPASAGPMPMPSDEDMELLELTWESRRG